MREYLGPLSLDPPPQQQQQHSEYICNNTIIQTHHSQLTEKLPASVSNIKYNLASRTQGKNIFNLCRSGILFFKNLIKAFVFLVCVGKFRIFIKKIQKKCHLFDKVPDTAGGGTEAATAEEEEDQQEADSQSQEGGIARGDNIIRVEHSCWSRSIEILCSDWVGSWCCYASPLLI